MRLRFVTLASVLALGLAALPARGDARTGTLTLDGLSFLSFEDAENLAIPSGSTIKFRFGEAQGATAAFTIQPSDVSIPPISLGGDRGELVYGLSAPASGTISRGPGGYRIVFDAEVAATLVHPTQRGTRTHALVFTTENASARSLVTGATVAVDGMRAIPGPRYVQLVGAVANPAEAYPQPGRAAYSVLSGSFDWLPALGE